MIFESEVADECIRGLLARFGASVCGAELVCDGDFCGHVTASARVRNTEGTHVLRVWSGKNQRWQLPGAHGEDDLDLEKVARWEALRALGMRETAALSGGGVVDIIREEVAEYWNTPAHVHMVVVFEYVTEEGEKLPRGARWFDTEAG